jgi:hypothetical protein
MAMSDDNHEAERLNKAVERALAAWERIKADNYWNDWLEIGEALFDGKTIMLRQLGINRPEDAGKRWAQHFGAWL